MFTNSLLRPSSFKFLKNVSDEFDEMTVRARAFQFISTKKINS